MKKWKLAFISVLVIALLAIIISVVAKASKERKAYIYTAQSKYERIVSCINEEEYSTAMDKMDDYEKACLKTDKYYDDLPADLKVDECIPKLKKQMVDDLLQKSSSLYEKLSAKESLTYDTDYNDLSNAQRYFAVLVYDYDYLNTNKALSHVSISDLRDKLNICNYRSAIVLYNSGDRSGGIKELEQLQEKNDLSADLRKKVNSLLTQAKNIRATSFEILSGSGGVMVYTNGRNYGWKCPKCGYVNEAIGTASIHAELGNHYSGEISNMSGAMFCASNFKGGCGQMSPYSLKIEYK